MTERTIRQSAGPGVERTVGATTELDAMGLIHGAIRMLFDRDANLPDEVGERCIAHRLALYIEIILRQRGEAWDVDCEYNRDGDDPKRVDGGPTRSAAGRG